MVFGWFRSARRRKLLKEPLSREWLAHIERNVTIYSRLATAQQRKLVEATRVIAAERRFVGCKGLVVTDEMKVTIAAQAALLLLGEDGYYFDRVTSFLLYPFKMVLPAHGIRPSSDESDFDERVILGQAFQQGEIILSWPDVLSGGRIPDDGENVVLHELAHHLDGLDGQMGGSPPALARDRQDHFHRVFEAAVSRLRLELGDGRETVLLPAAAENATELFAYGTEAFFERPWELVAWDGELFACLREFYKADPRQWLPDAGGGGIETTFEDDEEDEDEDDGAGQGIADLPPLETADQHFARGQELLAEGQWDAAAADFDRCVKMDPSDQEALVWRGRSYLFAGHVDAALADAERACRLASDDVEAQAVRGMCLTAAGRYAEALAAFEQAGDEVPVDIEALASRGIAHAETGDYRQALADFSHVIELDPTDGEAWYERSLCQGRLGRHEEAERDLAMARKMGFEEDGETERGSDRATE